RMELQGFAEEQAALRRVAMLIAQGVPPEEVFAAVAAEAGRVLGADFTFLSRYGPDHSGPIVGPWAQDGTTPVFPVGSPLNRRRPMHPHWAESPPAAIPHPPAWAD